MSEPVYEVTGVMAACPFSDEKIPIIDAKRIKLLIYNADVMKKFKKSIRGKKGYRLPITYSKKTGSFYMTIIVTDIFKSKMGDEMLKMPRAQWVNKFFKISLVVKRSIYQFRGEQGRRLIFSLHKIELEQPEKT